MARKSSRQKNRQRNIEPVFARDPRTGVEVAIHGDAQPTEERVRHLIAHLVEFAPVDALRVPIKRVPIELGGRAQTARRLQDGMDLMHENGKINDSELIAAREYQHAFLRASFAPFGTIDPTRIPGGRGLDPADAMAMRVGAVKKLREMQAFLGDARAMAFLAVDCVAGRGVSLRQMAREHGQNHQFWSAAFKCGLQSIVHGYMEGRRKQRHSGHARRGA